MLKTEGKRGTMESLSMTLEVPIHEPTTTPLVPREGSQREARMKLSYNRDQSTAVPFHSFSESQDDSDEDWDEFVMGSQAVGLFDSAGEASQGCAPRRSHRRQTTVNLEALRSAFLAVPDDGTGRLDDLIEELGAPVRVDQALSSQCKRRAFGAVTHRISALKRQGGPGLEAVLADLEQARCVTLMNSLWLEGGSLDMADAAGHPLPCSTLSSICSSSHPSSEKVDEATAPGPACKGGSARRMHRLCDVTRSRVAHHAVETHEPGQASSPSPLEAEQPQCGPAFMHLRWKHNLHRSRSAKRSSPGWQAPSIDGACVAQQPFSCP